VIDYRRSGHTTDSFASYTLSLRDQGDDENGWRVGILMFMFGIDCVRCNYDIIAPRHSEFLHDGVIRHVWHCPKCKARFESFPRFPPDAKLVREAMMKVDVFPALAETQEQ